MCTEGFQKECLASAEVTPQEANAPVASFDARELAFEGGKVVVNAGTDRIQSLVGDLADTQVFNDTIARDTVEASAQVGPTHLKASGSSSIVIGGSIPAFCSFFIIPVTRIRMRPTGMATLLAS